MMKMMDGYLMSGLVENRKDKMSQSNFTKMLDCPFCGKIPDLDDPDTLYHGGIYWRYDDIGIKKYIHLKD